MSGLPEPLLVLSMHCVSPWPPIGTPSTLQGRIDCAATIIHSTEADILFTINFYEHLQESLKNRGRHTVNDIAQRFRDILPGHPHLFVLERATGSGMLHVHGVLDAGMLCETDVKSAFRKVAGDIRKVPSSRRSFANLYAVHVEKADPEKSWGGRYGLMGWCSYITKNIQKTQKALKLPRPPVFISQNLRRLVNGTHEY